MTDGISVTPGGTLIAELLGIVLVCYIAVWKPLSAFAPRRIADPIIGISCALLVAFLLTAPVVREHVLSTLHLTRLP